jgi:chemotaxis protein methyltransferase CheR
MYVVLGEKCFSDFIKLIHDLTGITIANNRTSMIEGRLRKRVTALNLGSYEDYLLLVLENKKEQAHFIDLVTTNETYFFRTPRIWEYIQNKLLPNWFSNHPKQVFMAWSAAASTGAEAHSLGVICQEFKEKNPFFTYQIIGTDISQEMVQLCQKGEYSGKSIQIFQTSRPELFNKYMRATRNEGYQAIPEIRSRIRFQPHNLFRPLQTKDRFDLVLIRNVLIYFKGADQENVLSLIAPKLTEDGLLIIGESESLSHINTSFKHIEPLVYNLDSAQPSVLKAS